MDAPIFDAHATTADRKYPLLKLALAGRHQLENAAVAVSILERWSTLVSNVSTEAIVTGLTDCEWPARLEWLRVPLDSDGPSHGALLIDAAHNPAGAAALASYLHDTGAEKMPIVMAAMADKDANSMIAALAPAASAFIATTVPNARARSRISWRRRFASSRRPSRSNRRFAGRGGGAALKHLPTVACGGGSRRAVLGSIYMIGPLRSRCSPMRHPPVAPPQAR